MVVVAIDAAWATLPETIATVTNQSLNILFPLRCAAFMHSTIFFFPLPNLRRSGGAVKSSVLKKLRGTEYQ